MGVPAFYRWIREKYPKCIEDCVEDMPGSADGVEIPVHVAGPNPNGIEFDNLYIDMNGVIHPCVHPEDVPAPKTVEEMFAAIIAYVDRLMAAVRPRRLVYLAIDGVAPRAKMNQQRSRRFKAAQEMAEEEEVEARLRASLVSKGQKVPPKKAHTFDHNVITPGTWFMDQLSIHLRYHITQRVNAVPGWRDVRVILSDASVPGEGEHKIMDFIRQQRAAPGYNPNTVHCIHGLDADLIMLALATHEPRFSILREDVLGKAGGASKCFVCGREGHTANQCTGAAAPPPSWEAAEEDAAAAAAGKKGSHDDAPNSLRSLITRKPLQFLHIPILREYLDLEFRPYVAPLLPPGWGAVGATSGGPGAAAAAAAAGAIVPHAGGGAAGPLPSPYSTERVIDDFVFLCFFCGNDFLPHLPSMDIREGAIDLLLALYKQLLPGLGGYLTEGGHVNLARVDVLLGRVGAAETEIFRRRRVKEERDAQREAQRNGQKRAEAAARDRRAAASALAGDAAGAAASGGAGLLPAPVSGVGAGGIGSVSLAGAGSRRPRNGGGVDSGSVGPDDSVSVAGDAAGGTEAGSGKVKGKGKGLLGGRKEAASAAYRSATGAAEAALKEGMAAMVADKKKAAAAAAAPAGGAAAAAYAPSSPLLAPPPAKRGRHTTFNEAGQASGAEGAADGVDPAAPPATGAAAPVADAANRSAAQDLRSKLLGLRPLLDKAAAAAPAASEAPAAAAVAAGAGSAESEAHPPSMQLDAAAAAAAAAPADAAAPAPAAAGAGEGAGEGELFIPDDAYEHGVEMAAQRRKLQAAEAARAARAGGPDETEGEAEGEASQHAAVSGSGDASTVVSEAASGVGAGGGFASAVSVVTAASEDGLSTAVSAVSTGVGGLAGAGEEEDDSPHTAALEAEALEEGVVEAEVAAAITGQLKTAVLQALLEKRTHEGVADEVRLGSAGDRDRYYKAKFGEEAGSDPAFIRGVCRSYIEGLVWVYRYYYAGVASWKWFYPHHYAPFASDLRGLDSMAPITFELGRPFRPLDQLMGVLPPRSAHALPPACTALMTQEDSPVRDFYPEKFDMVRSWGAGQGGRLRGTRARKGRQQGRAVGGLPGEARPVFRTIACVAAGDARLTDNCCSCKPSAPVLRRRHALVALKRLHRCSPSLPSH
jgi:5'-3' exonuclease